MTHRTFWGIAALIVVLIAAGGFMYWQWSEVQQLKEEVAQDKKWLEEENKPVAETPIDYTKPPPGKTFANGGHWHNGEWHDEPHAPIAQPVKEPIISQVPSAPPKKVLSDEELREAFTKGRSKEELAAAREIDITLQPKIIEQLKRSIAKNEKTYNEMLARIRKYGPYKDPLLQQLFEQTKRDLEQDRLHLASTQRYMEVMYGYKSE